MSPSSKEPNFKSLGALDKSRVVVDDQPLPYGYSPTNAILERTKSCLEVFDTRLESARVDVVYVELDQQKARFNLWASTTGALRSGRRCLDYRLNESPEVRELIVGMLDTLLDSLVQSVEVTTESASSVRLLGAADTTGPHIDSLPTPHILIASVADDITLLQGLSNCIRRAGIESRNTKAATEFVLTEEGLDINECFRQFCLAMVKRDFPRCDRELQDRLADTMLLRRKRFLYRKHRQGGRSARLPGPAERELGMSAQPVKVNNSTERVSNNPELSRNESPSRGTTTTIDPEIFRRNYTPSRVYTANKSAASTSQGESFPPPPQITGAEGACPYCFLILPASDFGEQHNWREHVKVDLDALVCLFKGCNQSDQLWSRSHEWLTHMRQHCIRWKCTLKPHGGLVFETEAAYVEHMQESHSSKITEKQILLLARHNARPLEPIFSECPLCGLPGDEVKDDLESHVMQHLRILALACLPATDEHQSNVRDGHTLSLSSTERISVRTTVAGDPVEIPQESLLDLSHINTFPRSDLDEADKGFDWGSPDDIYGKVEDAVDDPIHAALDRAQRNPTPSRSLQAQSETTRMTGNLTALVEPSAYRTVQDPIQIHTPPLRMLPYRTESYQPASIENMHPAVQDLVDHLKRSQVPGISSLHGNRPAQFIPISKVNEYFRDDNLVRRLLRALAPDLPSRTILAPSVICQHYPRVLCILVLLGKWRFISHFTKYTFRDQQLPFTSEPKNFPSETGSGADFFQEFQATQWAFCAQEFNRDFHNVEFKDERILPIIEIREHRRGGSSTISKIRIHEDYDFLCPEQANGSEAHVYALKTYADNGGSAFQHYTNETEAFARLRSVDLVDSHIIEFYEGFVHRGKCNVILEFASWGTLEELFHTHPPEETGDILSFWRSLLLGLPQALVRLHESESCYGWHQDINPSNILVAWRDSGSWKLDLKLADFGLSRFTPTRVDGTIQKAIGRDNWGAGEYVAPEAARSDEFDSRTSIMVTQGVDIWSLGCIFSEAATWLASPAGGLYAYRSQRRRATQNMSHVKAKGCFHDNQKMLEVVENQHRSIQMRTRMDRRGDPLTCAVLQDLVQIMLHSSPDKRPPARTVYNKVKAVIEKAEQGQLSRDIFGAGFTEMEFPAPFLVSMPTPGRFPNRHTISSPGHRPSTQAVPGRSTSLYAPAPGPLLSPIEGIGPVVTCRSPDENLPEHVPSYPVQQGSGASHGHFSPIANQNDLGVDPQELNEGLKCITDNVDAHDNVQPQTPIKRQSATSLPSPPVTRPQLILSEAEARNWIARGISLSQIPGAPQLTHLDGRDHVFLIDDSDTMVAHWPALKSLSALLFHVVKDFGPNGVDFHFTVSDNTRRTRSIRTKRAFDEMFEARRPQSGPCDISIRLGQIFQAYGSRLESRFGHSLIPNRFRRQLRPMSVYILTDGQWQDDPEYVIRTLVQKMQDLGILRDQIGLEFISFGNDPEALRTLKRLDDDMGLQLDIVDTEPATGNVWNMLLAPVHSRFDDAG